MRVESSVPPASPSDFVAFWTLGNAFAPQLGWAAFDPPPFPWLQGIVSLGALLTATIVLTKQNRLAKLEELRHDLPNVKDRHDPEAAALQQPTDPQVMLAALDERRETEERSKSAAETREEP